MPGAELQSAQVWLLWLDLGLLVGLGALWCWRERGSFGPVESPWLLVAVGLLALLLRLLISPHTLVHENAHGYEYLRAAFSLEGYFYHGAGYYAFFHLVCGLFGNQPEVVFITNCLLGAVSSVLLIPLGRKLMGSREAGVVAALGYACLPAALRIGASESMFPLAIFFALFAWLVWLRAWETGSAILFLAAAILSTYTVQVRPVLALWPLVMLLSLPVCRGWTARFRSPWPWVALVVFGGLSSVWLGFRIEVMAVEGLGQVVRPALSDFLGGLFSANFLWLRFAWTPGILWLLSGAGLFFIARSWRPLPALVLGFLIMAWPIMGVETGESSSLRLQSPLHPLLLLWAGAGAAGFAEWCKPRRRLACLVLMGLLLLATSLARAPRIRESFNPQREFAFLEQAIPQLPKDCAIIVADRFMAGRVVSTEFPHWWAEGRPVEQLSNYLKNPQDLNDRSCRVFYLGLSCYCFTHLETDLPADGVRPECRRLDHRLGRASIETRFANRPDTAFRMPAEWITLGFYQLD